MLPTDLFSGLSLFFWKRGGSGEIFWGWNMYTETILYTAADTEHNPLHAPLGLSFISREGQGPILEAWP